MTASIHDVRDPLVPYVHVSGSTPTGNQAFSLLASIQRLNVAIPSHSLSIFKVDDRLYVCSHQDIFISDTMESLYFQYSPQT